jgi:hypothetical protein
MIITDSIGFRESDLVVGLTFCTMSYLTRYTIVRELDEHHGLEYTVKDEYNNLYCAFMDHGYLNIYGVQYIDLGLPSALTCGTRIDIDFDEIKEYMCCNFRQFDIKVCE